MLLMALPNEHLMTFNQYKDAKTLFAAIETRFDGNKATKKTQKTLPKQLYENFSAPSTESLILSLIGFRRLNKSDLDTMSIDELYNKFKLIEKEVKGTTCSDSSSLNKAFMTSPSTNGTNEVPTTYGVSTASTQSSTASTEVSTANLSDATMYAFLSNQSNGSQLIHEDLEQIHEDDLEEMDLKWQLALLSMRAKRSWNQDSSRRTMNVKETPPKAMVAIDGVSFDWSYMAEDKVPTNMALIAFSDSEKEITNELKESPDAPLVKNRVSDNKDCVVESHVVVKKKTVAPTITKIEFVKAKQQEKPVRKPVKYAEMYMSQGLERSDSWDWGKVTWAGRGKVNATKDETSGIIKKFITEIENLVDKKVKVIRSDNGTEFKNRVLNDFCAIKVDSKLPTTFWVEAVNTACYVQNRVLVVKPHNKTLYELFRGRSPTLSFMKPFWCHVTILNTLDHLGKFDRKANEGAGPKWLFDIDMLIESMNYVPVIVGIIKKFITEIENLVDKKVKVIRSDNRTELKNSVLNDFCAMKGAGPKWLFDIDMLIESMNYVPVIVATHADFLGDQPEGDMSNINTTYQVPSTPNTRIHKDHSLDLVIGDVQSDLPKGKKAIGIKWVFRKKKDERGIKNKVRLVTQGYTQEEGIDYDEVFAPVARIKVIRLFLAYASFMGFMVYQMDVKSAFLYGRIEEEVYVCQPLRFKDPNHPDKVYKVVKALYGFHQAPRAWFQMSSMGELTFFLGLQVKQKEDEIFISQDKYVTEVLRKFNLSDAKSANTLVDAKKPLVKDTNYDDVDVHLYRSMIRSLMYLTTSKPDIIYLKGHSKFGLWYLKDFPFELVAYTDSDYAGSSLDRKSTTGGCQFLEKRLISWQCKKQNIVATSTTEDEYVAATSCCG
nr:retrovirus-related Pol polyprotein from transposon TNT 1-94 [Tanacetum cinerariifolium]